LPLASIGALTFTPNPSALALFDALTAVANERDRKTDTHNERQLDDAAKSRPSWPVG
jgi:hypothetical protein